MAIKKITKEDLKTLTRKALQQIAKTNGIPANKKSSEIIDKLMEKYPDGVERPVTGSSRVKVTVPQVQAAIGIAKSAEKSKKLNVVNKSTGAAAKAVVESRKTRSQTKENREIEDKGTRTRLVVSNNQIQVPASASSAAAGVIEEVEREVTEAAASYDEPAVENEDGGQAGGEPAGQGSAVLSSSLRNLQDVTNTIPRGDKSGQVETNVGGAVETITDNKNTVETEPTDEEKACEFSFNEVIPVQGLRASDEHEDDEDVTDDEANEAEKDFAQAPWTLRPADWTVNKRPWDLDDEDDDVKGRPEKQRQLE